MIKISFKIGEYSAEVTDNDVHALIATCAQVGDALEDLVASDVANNGAGAPVSEAGSDPNAPVKKPRAPRGSKKTALEAPPVAPTANALQTVGTWTPPGTGQPGSPNLTGNPAMAGTPFLTPEMGGPPALNGPVLPPPSPMQQSFQNGPGGPVPGQVDTQFVNGAVGQPVTQHVGNIGPRPAPFAMPAIAQPPGANLTQSPLPDPEAMALAQHLNETLTHYEGKFPNHHAYTHGQFLTAVSKYTGRQDLDLNRARAGLTYLTKDQLSGIAHDFKQALGA